MLGSHCLCVCGEHRVVCRQIRSGLCCARRVEC
jgi:hypothetical protein